MADIPTNWDKVIIRSVEFLKSKFTSQVLGTHWTVFGEFFFWLFCLKFIETFKFVIRHTVYQKHVKYLIFPGLL